ncbi:MAG: methionine synthase, partial [Bdellovibrionales bacterium]|nr:methionine synthase [Bdellovibrionales bacterium]
VDYKSKYKLLREDYEKKELTKEPLLSIEEARKYKESVSFDSESVAQPEKTGIFEFFPTVSQLKDFIDWSPFFWTWQLKGLYPKIFDHPKYGLEAKKVFDDAIVMLKKIESDKNFQPKAVVGIFKALKENETVTLFDQNQSVAQFTFPRQRLMSLIKKPAKKDQPSREVARCLADYVSDRESVQDFLTLFSTTAGQELEDYANQLKMDGDDYNSILVKALADRLAEACTEWVHLEVRKIFGFGKTEDLSNEELIAEKYRGVRPAPGYPACPVHKDKATIWKLIEPDKRIGVTLTESFSMSPASSVSGFIFNHPQARYFDVGRQD